MQVGGAGTARASEWSGAERASTSRVLGLKTAYLERIIVYRSISLCAAFFLLF